jgi:MoaA/NifB/PqqE/SkfB family radical SAM enzyme
MIEKININNKFPILKKYLKFDAVNGIYIKFDGNHESNFIPESTYLKYYYVNDNTYSIIKHNIEWANGLISKPKFQFIYLMLPNYCNQSCRGCFMGHDKKNIPEYFFGNKFSDKELNEILSFAVEHNVKSIIYGGGGELFTWKHAYDYIKKIHEFGLKMVIFTNGTLLTKKNIEILNEYGVTLIISLRDIVEKYHNEFVNLNGFIKSLMSVENALSLNMQKDNRLSIEIPVTKLNESRILNDFLPVMRNLGIVPMIEEYIRISASEQEKSLSHTFQESREYFNKLHNIDKKNKINWNLEYGTRLLGQPGCRRSLYSFAIYPSRDVVDCPSNFVSYDNLKNHTLREIIYSDKFKNNIIHNKFCACSVFYTNNKIEIPSKLPNYLEELR